MAAMARSMLATVVLMAILMAAGAALTAGPASAQDREMRAMRDRIENLEGQLKSITRYLSNNQDAPRNYQAGDGAAGEGAVNQLANMEVRLGSLESQIRTLTGQIEEMQHQIRQLNDRADRLAEPAAPAAGQPFTDGAPGAPLTPDGGQGNAQAGGQGAAADGTQAPGESEPLPTGEPTALYNAALARLRQDDFQGAAKGFNEFILQFPDNDLTPNAQYWLGESYYAQQNYSEAARAFLTAYTKYPESSKASGALLKLGISLGELDQKDDACAALGEFGRKYPNASAIELNRAKVARQDLNCS
jgi:tol-pal system protein YbgF